MLSKLCGHEDGLKIQQNLNLPVEAEPPERFWKNWAGSGGSSIDSIRASPRNAKREHCWTAGAAQGTCHTKQTFKKILALASRHSRSTGDHATPENTSSHTQRHTKIWHYIEVILTWQRCWLWPRRREREQTTSKPTTQKKKSIVCRLQRAKDIYKRLLQLSSDHLQIRTKSKRMPKNPNVINKGKNSGIIADPPGLSGVPWHFGWPLNMISLLCILKSTTTKVKGGGSRGKKGGFSAYIFIWK